LLLDHNPIELRNRKRAPGFLFFQISQKLESQMGTGVEIGPAADLGRVRQALDCHWRPLLASLMVMALYAPVILRLVTQWATDPNYSHGLLVPFFSAYLIWRQRHILKTVTQRPSNFGMLIVLAGIGLLFLGSLGAELFLARISLLFVIVGLIIHFAGRAYLSAVAFPVAFLGTMVPLPAIIYNQLVFPLQLMASRLATCFLQTTNVVPVLREGDLLILPNYTLEVVDACSGIRSLMTLVALALAYGYLAERNWAIRAALVVIMVPVAITSNALRVALTAMAARYFNPVAAEAFFHKFSGWFIFLISTAMLFGFHSILSRARRRHRREPAR
jgi:exosortase